MKIKLKKNALPTGFLFGHPMDRIFFFTYGWPYSRMQAGLVRVPISQTNMFCIIDVQVSTNLNESISLSSSKSYRRAEIGYVMELNFVRK